MKIQRLSTENNYQKEQKSNKSKWSQLPIEIKREISSMYINPKSLGIGISHLYRPFPRLSSKSKEESEWKDRIWPKSCPSHSFPPRIRQRPVIGRTVLDHNLICDNHPLLSPWQSRGEFDSPCCLPLVIDEPAQWSNVLKFLKHTSFVKIAMYFPNGYIDNVKNLSQETGNDLIRQFEFALTDWLRMNRGNLEVRIDGFPKGDTKGYNLVNYEWNRENGRWEAMYPDYSIGNINWNLASDLSDEEVIEQISDPDFVKIESLKKYLDSGNENFTLYNRENLKKLIENKFK